MQSIKVKTSDEAWSVFKLPEELMYSHLLEALNAHFTLLLKNQMTKTKKFRIYYFIGNLKDESNKLVRVRSERRFMKCLKSAAAQSQKAKFYLQETIPESLRFYKVKRENLIKAKVDEFKIIPKLSNSFRIIDIDTPWATNDELRQPNRVRAQQQNQPNQDRCLSKIVQGLKTPSLIANYLRVRKSNHQNANKQNQVDMTTNELLFLVDSL